MRTLVRQSRWIVLAAVLALPQATFAQGHPQTRQGFWIGLGVGWGSLGCTGCNTRESSGAATLKLGGTLNQQVLLGVESSAWTKNYDAGRLTHATVAFVGQFYPTPESGFFLQGGVGVSELRVEASGFGLNFAATDRGFGATAGLGYDARLGSNFSLTPYGLYTWGNFDGGNADHFQLGLGVTWH